MTSTIPNMFYMLFIVFQTARDVAVQTMITQQAPLCLQKKIDCRSSWTSL